nr:hypothetical protein CFP56_09940 [Quercus suber]
MIPVDRVAESADELAIRHYIYRIRGSALTHDLLSLETRDFFSVRVFDQRTPVIREQLSLAPAAVQTVAPSRVRNHRPTTSFFVSLHSTAHPARTTSTTSAAHRIASHLQQRITHAHTDRAISSRQLTYNMSNQGYYGGGPPQQQYPPQSYQQPGYGQPQQMNYGQQQQMNYGQPPQGQYYQQQQAPPMQQERRGGGGGCCGGCFKGILAALCCCCVMEEGCECCAECCECAEDCC